MTPRSEGGHVGSSGCGVLVREAACLGPYFAGGSIVAPGTVMGTTTGAEVRRAKFGKRAAPEAEPTPAGGGRGGRHALFMRLARLSACGVEGWLRYGYG